MAKRKKKICGMGIQRYEKVYTVLNNLDDSSVTKQKCIYQKARQHN